MQFGKSVLSPSYSRKPDFDSQDSIKNCYGFRFRLLFQLCCWINKIISGKKAFSFICVNCQKEIGIDYESIIGKEFSWSDDFDEKTNEEIKQFYDMNEGGKTPDGGWTAIDKCLCGRCQTQYLIYAGVDEYLNSTFKVTLQGITEIIEDEQNK